MLEICLYQCWFEFHLQSVKFKRTDFHLNLSYFWVKEQLKQKLTIRCLYYSNFKRFVFWSEVCLSQYEIQRLVYKSEEEIPINRLLNKLKKIRIYSVNFSSSLFQYAICRQTIVKLYADKLLLSDKLLLIVQTIYIQLATVSLTARKLRFLSIVVWTRFYRNLQRVTQLLVT